jgi:hypothetical protein
VTHAPLIYITNQLSVSINENPFLKQQKQEIHPSYFIKESFSVHPEIISPQSQIWHIESSGELHYPLLLLLHEVDRLIRHRVLSVLHVDLK